MRTVTGRVWLGMLFVLAMLPTRAASALAEVSLEVTTTGEVVLGDELQVMVRVSEDGAPVAGTVVMLTREAGFGGVDAYVELARARTGPDGLAVLSYRQSFEPSGDLRLTLEEYPEAETTVHVSVSDRGRQLYRSQSGVEVPGLNVLLLVAVVVGVWVSMLVAVSLVSRLSRATRVEIPGRRRGAGRPAMPVILGTITAGIWLVLLVVLARNPTTHANLEGPDGHDRTPHAHLEELTPYPGFGIAEGETTEGDPVVAGRTAYVGYGCVACHGLEGAGAVVGGDLGSATRDDLESFVRDVRKGPKVMPEYDESVLDDETLALIHTYLEEMAGT